MVRRLMKVVASAAALVLVGGVGVGVGKLLRATATALPKDTSLTLASGLAVGDPFPQVRLASSAGDTLSTTGLLQRRGRVVVFLEPGCPPCERAVLRWQLLIDAGTLDADAVIGVTNGTLEDAETYRTAHKLSFDVYRDVEQQFLRDYRIDVFPFEIIVGRSGAIRSMTGNPVAHVDVARVLRELAS